MNLRELINLTLERVGEREGNRRIDSVIKNAVNHAYLYDLSEKDKRLSTAYIPVINGLATLPEDINTIESISPSLIGGERRIGNAILSSRDTVFTVTYSSVREPLVEDTDEPDLNQKYQYLLSTYACYEYYNLKQDNRANMFLNEYQNELEKILNGDNTGDETIQDVYGGGVDA
jgi:hypothetical protein